MLLYYYLSIYMYQQKKEKKEVIRHTRMLLDCIYERYLIVNNLTYCVRFKFIKIFHIGMCVYDRIGGTCTCV